MVFQLYVALGFHAWLQEPPFAGRGGDAAQTDSASSSLLLPELLYFYLFMYISILGKILFKRHRCFRKKLEIHQLSSSVSHSKTYVPLSSIMLGWSMEG